MVARGGIGRRIHRFLRNPRLALGLLAFVGIWMVLGTLGWAGAYSHPLFLVALLWLAASTVVCAWERTARTASVWRARGTLTPSQLERLRASDPIALTPAEETAPDRALSRASAALRRLGLHARTGPRIIEASSGAWALAGSPLFHWSLVALLVLIPVGRLSRSEGMIGIVEGSSRVDEAASYGRLEEGPLNASFSGLTIGVEPDMELDFHEDGISRGEAPTVTVSAQGQELARQRVYPNHPLRHGPLMIHMDDFGLGVLYTIEDGSGASLTDQALLDFVEGDKTRTVPSVSTLEDDTGAPIATVTIQTAKTGGATQASDRRAAVTIETPDAAPITATAAIGEEVPFGDGMRLRIEHLGYYARLSVVDDWSVYWMYGLFVIGMIAVSVSILVPYRVVHVLLDDSGPRPVLRVQARHHRGSPEFADRVRKALAAKESE